MGDGYQRQQFPFELNQMFIRMDSSWFLYKYEFEINAVAKQRADKFGRTPPKTKEYEAIITEMAREQVKGSPVDKRLAMVVSFGVLDFRSDLDNLIKSISDGMQGVAMTNDSHIDCIIAVRHKTKEPLIEVQLYELS